MRSWSTIAACARIRIAPGCFSATVARWSPIGGIPRPRGRVAAARRPPRAGGDQDGEAVPLREREPGLGGVAVDGDLLRPRVELDAAGAELQAPLRLLHGPLRQVEPRQRHEPVAG